MRIYKSLASLRDELNYNRLAFRLESEENVFLLHFNNISSMFVAYALISS